jgi:hypothetical protein
VSKIHSFLAEYPRYPLSTQYAPVGGGMNCVVGFFNYFDQIFRGSNTAATLHLIFLDKDGTPTAERALRVPANGALQFDARREGIACDGMVVVAAMPEGDIDTINAGRVQVKPRVNTGFYVKWENAGGGRDLMHEWTSVQVAPLPKATHHVGYIRAQCEIEHGLVLMNPVAAEGATSVPSLVLRESGRSAALAKAMLDPIPSMGTRVVRLSSVFPDFATRLASGRPLVVDVVAENLSAPLTAEWHGQGDFHFHHI